MHTFYILKKIWSKFVGKVEWTQETALASSLKCVFATLSIFQHP